ncbi:MAG: HAD-IC family P-type ATPase, partial [archaeon]|nr:HAD-IC family P-type ATPase [archaeon]
CDLESINNMVEQLQSQGKTVVLIIINGKIVGFLGIADKLKPSAKGVIKALNNMKINTFILTGDNERTAKAIANQLGIKNYFAEVRPAQKLVKISELQKNSENIVAMVGDGINDAPALTKADVGIAIGSGTDVAVETADIVLIRGDLRTLVAAMILSKKTYTKMIQNLFWAFIYNIIGIPIAAGLFYGIIGTFLPPALASLFMAFSSVSVVTSALLLYRVNLNSIIENISIEIDNQSKISEEKSEKSLKSKELINEKQEGIQMASKLKCEKCGEEQPLSNFKHCGRDMIPRDGKLVCWMNLPKEEGGLDMDCGSTEIPIHCDQKMSVI